ncbi:MAG: beta-galactosidase, partial [Bacteroidaceae bacterium]|nr:beta-galactosidase [Bacteroidaceae bacterium]
MVYTRQLTVSEAQLKNQRLFLYFEGVNSVADVFVNRVTVGQHKGGYTAFCMEITDHLAVGDNTLEVWASNAFRTDVLPISGDFNVYGGIHRPVHLITTGRDCISPLFYASPGVLVHQDKITKEQAELTIETVLSLKSGRQGLQLKTSVMDASGKIVAEKETQAVGEHVKQPFTIAKPTLWNGRKNPYLYTIKVELLDGTNIIDEQTVQTGLRYFSVDKDKG